MNADKLRMVQWLALAVVFYGLALSLFAQQPQLQTLCWKLGNLTVAGFLGYWLDRRAFWYARLDATSAPLLQIRRAIVMAAAMLAVAMGL
jgi:Putative 2/3 transmembrane domain holin